MTCVCCARDWLASRVRRSRAMGVGGVGVGVGVVTDEWRVLARVRRMRSEASRVRRWRAWMETRDETRAEARWVA